MAQWTVTWKRGLRSVRGAFLDFFFCMCGFFSSVKSVGCLAAYCDVFQSGGQQAACTIRGHLRGKTSRGDLILLQSSGCFKSLKKP